MSAVAIDDLPEIGVTEARMDELRASLHGNSAEGQACPSDSSHTAGQAPAARERAYALRALEAEAAALRATVKGGRNDRLNKAAYALARFIPSGALSDAEVRQALTRAAVDTGLTRREIAATLNSGIGRGIANAATAFPATIQGNAGVSFTTARPPAAANASVIQLTWDGDPAPANPGWLAKDLLPRLGVALLAGLSGAGKSFVADHASICGAIGADFFGRRVRERFGTIFLLGEGQGTMRDRIEAARRGVVLPELARRQETDGELPLFDPNRLPIGWLSVTDLRQPAVMRAVIDQTISYGQEMKARFGVPLRLLVVDTLAACMGFEDENSAPETTKSMQLLEQLSRETDALVLATAHHGKGEAAGVRGSSALTASADVILTTNVEKDSLGAVTFRSLGLTKTRYGETGWATEFRLVSQHLRDDEDGDPVTSCYIEPTGADIVNVPRARALSPAAKAYRDALAAVVGDHGCPIRFGEDWPEVVSVDRERVRDEFYRRWPADGDTEAKRQAAKRKRFTDGERKAMEANVIGQREFNGTFHVWLISNE